MARYGKGDLDGGSKGFEEVTKIGRPTTLSHAVDG
jgi:hypothetical protein